MAREWKPGDVAMLTWDQGRFSGRDVAVKTTDGWHASFELHHEDVTDACPLVVLDPEDREQVDRLDRLIWDTVDDATAQADLQSALREFANPTPPKPDEPTGLGAVVEDTEGRKYTRTGRRDLAPWSLADAAVRVHYSFAEIDAVRVLSEGVQ